MSNFERLTERSGSLREMSDDAFRDRYGGDRFTSSVIANRLRYIVNHMATGFLREAFSPVLRDWYDFAMTISGPPDQDYSLCAVSNGLVIFLGTMADAVRNVVEEYGPEKLCAGDVLICNDPYRIGTHCMDVCFIRPIFWEGTLVSFVSVRAHQLDMGGATPGGFDPTHKSVFEAGITLGPQLLYSRGGVVKSTFSLLLENSRFPELMLPDTLTTAEQLRFGDELVQTTIGRYGIDAFLGTLRYVCDRSAARMRGAIEEIPDGDYEGIAYLDADGVDDSEEYVVCVALKKRGSNIEADLSGTSRQARTCLNATVLDAKTALAVALTMLLSPETEFTSGTWTNIDLVAPPGSLLTSRPPDGGTMFYYEPEQALVTAIFAALSSVLGDRAVAGDYGSISDHLAHGATPTGNQWASVSECGGEHGPWGATKGADGDSYTVVLLLNNLDPAVEAIEQGSPVVVLRKEAVVDTGGPGMYRGGAAVMKDSLWLHPGSHHSAPFHTKRPPGIGVAGGKAGRCGAVWMFHPDAVERNGSGQILSSSAEIYAESTPVGGVLDPETKTLSSDGKYFYFAAEPVWQLGARGVFRYQTSGGGGWGDPLEREAERVLRDVRDEYVSIQAAAREYGVVVVGDAISDPEGLRVDVRATRELRSAMAASAGADGPR